MSGWRVGGGGGGGGEDDDDDGGWEWSNEIVKCKGMKSECETFHDDDDEERRSIIKWRVNKKMNLRKRNCREKIKR